MPGGRRPLVSIVIPTRNYESYVAAAIRSALRLLSSRAVAQCEKTALTPAGVRRAGFESDMPSLVRAALAAEAQRRGSR